MALRLLVEIKDVLLLVAGFFLGIIGTYIFWFHMKSIKPHISISPKIAKGVGRVSGTPLYRIKIYNKTNRLTVNMTARISVSRIDKANGISRSVTVKKMDVKPFTDFYLGPANEKDKDWGLNPEKYMTFGKDTSIEDLMADDNHVVTFRITATDSASGTIVIFRKIYRKHDIVDGDFIDGPRHDIVPPGSAGR